MKKLRTILRYLGVCDGNMEQGSLRCDANISVRPVGQKQYGTRTEVKNINSFRFVEKALDYEIKRQIKVLEDGRKIVQETRLWDPTRGITESMRGKEEAHDYRYFPEPDLVPIVVEQQWIDEIKKSLPELPDIKIKRFISEYALPEHDADFLTSEKPLADWFEEAVKLGGQPKIVANWVQGDLMRLLNEENKSIEECPLKPEQLVDMLKLIDNGTISGKIAKTVFVEMYKASKKIYETLSTADITLQSLEISAPSSGEIVKKMGLTQISDQSEIEKVVDEVIAKHPKEAERFRLGEEKLIGFFVGQVMKFTKGKANPQMVNGLLKKKLSS
jgi:aspartyl-tRNA(Asn)/glutamyl-tRNA(Gln) amidotransferase subunit B